MVAVLIGVVLAGLGLVAAYMRRSQQKQLRRERRRERHRRVSAEWDLAMQQRQHD